MVITNLSSTLDYKKTLCSDKVRQLRTTASPHSFTQDLDLSYHSGYFLVGFLSV